MNLIHNDIGNNYIESIDNSISKELKSGLMNKIYYLNNPEGINLEKSILLISNNTNKNNNQPSNNPNEKKDIDININNINYQQNQISNSNIIFNVSYSKENQSPKINSSNQKSELPEIRPNPSVTKKELKNKNRRIQINEDKNIYYHYQKDSALEDTYQIYNRNEENLEVKKGLRDLNEYMKMIKANPTPKPCIKIFNEKEIKMNEGYLLAENLKEKDIIPDLYEEEDEDIKSLSQSLVRSIDKWFGHSLNDRFSTNESNYSENINDNSNSNNVGKNLINKLQNMIMEDINEVNENDKIEELTYEVDNENDDEDNNENVVENINNDDDIDNDSNDNDINNEE